MLFCENNVASVPYCCYCNYHSWFLLLWNVKVSPIHAVWIPPTTPSFIYISLNILFMYLCNAFAARIHTIFRHVQQKHTHTRRQTKLRKARKETCCLQKRSKVFLFCLCSDLGCSCSFIFIYYIFIALFFLLFFINFASSTH